MQYTAENVRDAYFAAQIDDEKTFCGNVAAAHAELVGENPDPEDTLEAWTRRYESGKEILKHAYLVYSCRQTGGADPLHGADCHGANALALEDVDSPIVQVPAGYIGTVEAVYRVALKGRA